MLRHIGRCLESGSRGILGVWIAGFGNAEYPQMRGSECGGVLHIITGREWNFEEERRMDVDLTN